MYIQLSASSPIALSTPTVTLFASALSVSAPVSATSGA